MKAHNLKVERTARYLTHGPLDERARTVWFVFHGYGQLAHDFLDELRPAFTQDDVLIVAPEALSRFYLRGTQGNVGSSWMTKHEREHEIADYLAYLNTLASVVANATADGCRWNVLGFSQGTATASRWAVQASPQPAQIVLWGGGFPPELQLGQIWASSDQPRIDLVVGSKDPYITKEHVTTEVKRLQNSGLSCTVKTYDGGHHIDSDLLTTLL